MKKKRVKKDVTTARIFNWLSDGVRNIEKPVAALPWTGNPWPFGDQHLSPTSTQWNCITGQFGSTFGQWGNTTEQWGSTAEEWSLTSGQWPPSGTGQWVIESLEFQTWLDEPQQILLCHGSIGTGKTVLASIVDDTVHSNFLNDDNISIVTAYLHEDVVPENLLASLLKQLLKGSQPFPAAVVELYERHAPESTDASIEQLLNTMEEVIKEFSRVYIIIDAIDVLSSAHRNDFLTELFKLRDSFSVNVFATSRSLPDVLDRFKGFSALKTGGPGTHEDLCRYFDQLPGEHDRAEKEVDRSDVLLANGGDPGLIARLLQDANAWVRVRRQLRNQVKAIRKFRTDYAKFGYGDQSLDKLASTTEDLAQIVNHRIDEHDKSSSALIELEFNLTSIREAQKSTILNRSIKRLSWITFIFLPLIFISGVFGMNVDILAANPSWWWYFVFATATLGLTITVWVIFKRYHNLEDNIENWMSWLVGPRASRDVEKGILPVHVKKRE